MHHLRPTDSETLGMGPSNLRFIKFSGDSGVSLSLRSTQLGQGSHLWLNIRITGGPKRKKKNAQMPVQPDQLNQNLWRQDSCQLLRWFSAWPRLRTTGQDLCLLNSPICKTDGSLPHPSYTPAFFRFPPLLHFQESLGVSHRCSG